jgi:tRNA nucleotidyltransferase (CCA-adding enzyme)
LTLEPTVAALGEAVVVVPDPVSCFRAAAAAVSAAALAAWALALEVTGAAFGVFG